MLRLVSLLATLSLVLTACSSSSERMDDDAGPGDAGRMGPDPIPADALCGMIADEYCLANERCCGRGAEVYATPSDCASAQRRLCENRMVGFEYPAEVASEDILYNQGRMGSALERIREAVAACRPIDFEEEILNGIMGRVAEGMPCVRVSCQDGLACIASTCSPQPGAGATCAGDDECGALRCRMDGTCQPFGNEGDGCDVDDDCVSRLCDAASCAPISADTTYCVRQDMDRRPFRR